MPAASATAPAGMATVAIALDARQGSGRRCSRLATTRTGPRPRIAPRRAQSRADRPPPGTGQPRAERPARGQYGAIRRCPASRRRCTRRASSPHGTAAPSAGTGQAAHRRGPASRTAATRTTASRQAASRRAVRWPLRRPGRRRRLPTGPLRRVITSRTAVQTADLVTRCWRSATRPRMSPRPRRGRRSAMGGRPESGLPRPGQAAPSRPDPPPRPFRPPVPPR